MPLPPRKKKPADFALLLGEPYKKPGLDDPDSEEFDDEAAMMDDEDELEDDDPLAAMDELGEEVPSLDPEQAALAETLGFTDPEQQQALVDLIKLVTSADPMATESSDMPPLPESTY